jgi:small-conductance mechanosensitive channel
VEGITVHKDKIQTNRNLTTTSLLLTEILRRTKNQIQHIKSNNKALSEIQKRLDSLAADKVLYVVPKDSIAKSNYFQQLIFLTKDITATNNNLKNAIDSIQTLEIKGTLFKFSLDSDIANIVQMRKIESDSLFTEKVPVFEAANDKEHSFLKVFKYSLKKGYLVLVFYIVNHFSAIELLFLCIIGITLYLNILKRKYIKANIYQEFKYPIQIFRHPFATATLITVTILQLFIPPPPFIFTSLLWCIACIALTILIKKTNTKQFLQTWLIYLALIVLAIVDNLILVHTVFETWMIIGIGMVSLAFGLYRIYNRKKIFETSISWIISLMIGFEILGLFFMINGNYNFGKMLVSIGILTILIGYLSIYTYQLGNDIIKFSNFLKETDDGSYIDKVNWENHKIKNGFYFLFCIGWIIIINRNSYSFQNFIDPFLAAYSEERKIGTFTYSYEGVVIFFFVLIVSVIISKIVSFLTDENKTRKNDEKSSSLGSWLLLIRIGIISSGIIIAFSTAGIPIDRLTVIIGALGVGIGFGLQTLVNNLVSGLIIAFEKPVNLDDIIEIGGQTGTMKSIGIRSSVVTTWDGADIIIPNGDLLSQHMTNWTMGSAKRRYEIKVGVAYGTDLKLAKSIINEVIDHTSLILKNPEPMIWATQFGDSSIDFVIKYWVPHFNYGNDVKSDLIMAIDEIFKVNGIVIPFPQHDVYIKSEATVNKKSEE